MGALLTQMLDQWAGLLLLEYGRRNLISLVELMVAEGKASGKLNQAHPAKRPRPFSLPSPCDPRSQNQPASQGAWAESQSPFLWGLTSKTGQGESWVICQGAGGRMPPALEKHDLINRYLLPKTRADSGLLC